MSSKLKSSRTNALGAWALAFGLAILLVVGAFISWTAHARGLALVSLLPAAGLLVLLPWGFRSWRRLKFDSDVQQAMLAASPGGFRFVDFRDGGERLSPGFCPAFGLKDGDGADGAKGFESFMAALDRDHETHLSAALDSLRAGGEDFVMTVAALNGGRHFEVDARAVPDRDAAIGMNLWIRDVSDRVAASAAERDARDRLVETLDAVPLPIWRRDADHALTYCNRAYAEIVETDAATATAGRGIELVAETDHKLAYDLADRARQTGDVQHADHHVVVAGARRLLHIAEVPLGDGAGDSQGESRGNSRVGTIGTAWDVTAMEDARRDLNEHIAAHAEVIGSLSIAIVIFGPDKQLEFANEAYAKLFDLDPEWLRGKPLYWEVLEYLRTKRRLPEVPDFAVFRAKREAMFTDLIEPYEEVMFLPSGITVHLKIIQHPFGGLMFAFEDVTDTLALESTLNTLIAVQRATLDNLYEGVAVFGSDGRLKLHNPGFARIWKLNAEQLDGEPHISDVLDMTRDLYDYGDDWAIHKARIIAHTTERSPSFNRLDRTDDTVLEWASFPLPDGATLMTYLDVTDSNDVELALRQRNEALREADRLKSEFISNVSYELRTPLNTIIGFSELLSAGFFGSLETRQAEYVQGIFDSSQHLLQLINDILDLATIEAGYMQLDVGAFNIDDMLASILTLTNERMRTENVTLDFDCPATLGEMVGDERRIKQLVFHLLSNAIKFSPDGGTVILNVTHDTSILAISVSDMGSGIADEDLARLFEKFWRRDNIPLHATGSGLGLPLVKSFVELHGGHIDVESGDAGTKITCYLPMDVNPKDD